MQMIESLEDEYQGKCGIYKITNKINGKCYIGQSVDIKRRWREHINHAKRKDKEGKEFGHMAEIEGRVADNPQKIRGDRVERLFFEEIGSNKVFEKSYLQGEALVTVMGRKIGTRIA